MKRRDFLTHTAVALVGSNFFPLAFRPFFSFAGRYSFPEAETAAFPLNELTIDQLQAEMKGGRLSSEKITRLYMMRIEEMDKKGVALRSVIELNPDAVQLAKALDKERKNGKLRGPLHGIPVLLKDNIDTADKMMTTAGSLALLHHRAQKDAFVVRQLRAAGAVIMGKTNLSEWANFRSTRSVSGWSSRGGQTRNPYVLDRTPCGSSSGSAVAVAANLCAVAVGTETNGSISCPASMNSVVGIKPTVGLVSRSGIIPISKSQDTAGPLARSVKDAAILLGVLAGRDPEDATTEGGKVEKDYTRYLDGNGLAGKRIGVEKSFLTGHEAITALFKKAIEQMRSKGATIVEVEFMEKFRQIGVEQTKVLQYEFKDGLNKYLASANAPVKSLEDVIRFNKQHEADVMPFFKQETLERSQARGSLEDKEYSAALDRYKEARAFFIRFFSDHELHALCGPANGHPWCVDFINGDSFTGYGTYGPAAVCGHPSITVPMGNTGELPLGISFLGTPYSEPELIKIGYAYEQATKSRIIPRFKQTFSPPKS